MNLREMKLLKHRDWIVRPGLFDREADIRWVVAVYDTHVLSLGATYSKENIGSLVFSFHILSLKQLGDWKIVKDSALWDGATDYWEECLWRTRDIKRFVKKYTRYEAKTPMEMFGGK